MKAGNTRDSSEISERPPKSLRIPRDTGDVRDACGISGQNENIPKLGSNVKRKRKFAEGLQGV
jgi:hypothetical protein